MQNFHQEGGRTPGTPYAGSATVNNCNLTCSTSKFKMTIIVLSGGRVQMHFVWCYRYSRGRVSSFTCSTCPVCCILFGVYSYSSGHASNMLHALLVQSAIFYLVLQVLLLPCATMLPALLVQSVVFCSVLQVLPRPCVQCYLLYLSSLLYFWCFRYCRGRVSNMLPALLIQSAVFCLVFTGIAAAVRPQCYLFYLSTLLYFVLCLQVLPRPFVQYVTCSTCPVCWGRVYVCPSAYQER